VTGKRLTGKRLFRDGQTPRGAIINKPCSHRLLSDAGSRSPMDNADSMPPSLSTNHGDVAVPGFHLSPFVAVRPVHQFMIHKAV